MLLCKLDALNESLNEFAAHSDAGALRRFSIHGRLIASRHPGKSIRLNWSQNDTMTVF